MISIGYLTIRRSILAMVCLFMLIVSDSWAQAGQESLGTEASPDETSDSADLQTQAENEGKPKTGKSEVEYNEDNYRRFMELKDRDRRGNTLPTNAYQPGKQKLDELPEESQKHLRNELRSVIVQEGEWQEGDENKQYAYVPSEAAESNFELQELEAEAWIELVDKYQEREAQIHANSARSEAARQASAAAGGRAGQTDKQGKKGSAGQQGQAGQEGSQDRQSSESGQPGAQNLQQSQNDQSSASSKDSYSPAEAAAKQEAARNQGVSENALKFLMQGQQQDASQGQSIKQSGNPGAATETRSVANTGGQSQPQGEDTSGDQAEQQAGLDEKKETGTTQNAFEQLRGSSQQQDTPPDTLLIEDLINVQGVMGEVPVQKPDNYQDTSPESQKEEVPEGF